MGTHPNGPAQIPSKSTSLKEFLEVNKEALGSHESGDLQFLFKVLSVAKALSVQSHPTKELAKVLHARDPKNYPDDNHKPEMTIALTDFEVLFLQEIFTKLMNSKTSEIDLVIKEIVERISKKENRSELENLFLRLEKQYPDADVGVFSPLLLNFLKLKPGESVFLGPNEPHAYLDGDCIECMACSDNTIRAGLTPKFKDVPTLVSTLTYNTSGPTYLNPKEVVSGVFEYKPPVPEFSVQRILPSATLLNDTKSSGILIVVSGETKIGSIEAKKGTVVFFEAGSGDVEMESSSSDFLGFRAYTPTPGSVL
ncbi:hypothetical protein FO519_009274 [Halicephalobus sp. NKZ332]|nr:hypothetical protein FO519_009274 [Halicephalobus sp. NKZ332]